MNKMKIAFNRSYKSQNGNPVFVYVVTGAKSLLEKFKELQGDYYREDDKGRALFFTTRYAGKSGDLIITTNDNVVIDTSQFDAAASLAAQYGGNFGQALANKAAEQLLGTNDSPEESGQSQQSEAPSGQSQQIEQASPDDIEAPESGLGDA